MAGPHIVIDPKTIEEPSPRRDSNQICTGSKGPRNYKLRMPTKHARHEVDVFRLAGVTNPPLQPVTRIL